MVEEEEYAVILGSKKKKSMRIHFKNLPVENKC